MCVTVLEARVCVYMLNRLCSGVDVRYGAELLCPPLKGGRS